MVKTLLNLFKKPKAGAELLTELDITRVVGGEERLLLSTVGGHHRHTRFGPPGGRHAGRYT